MLFTFGSSSDNYNTNIKLIEDTLINYLPVNNWFIAGGYAVNKYRNTGKHTYKDIDIYFHTKDDYVKAHTKLRANNDVQSHYNTVFADTFYIKSIATTIQLIHSQFGTPKQVLPNFDLSCCRVYMTPDKKLNTYKYNNDKIIINPNNITVKMIQRINKYATRFNLDPTDAYNDVINYIDNNIDKQILDYYTNKKVHIKKILSNVGYTAENTKIEIKLIKILEKLKNKELLEYYLNNNFLKITLLEKENNFTDYTKLMIYVKSEIKPSEDILKKYPEYFL